MASFTDTQPPKFNPYIQQLPVEAMVAVGTQKQKAYEEGVQKIQTQVDNIAGLDVARDVDKAYLQSKINQLGNKLRTVASGDFSNFQFVNSVGGMTKQVIRDEGVQNAVNSTAKMRKELAFMEEEKKAGKLTPDNELHFNKKLNKWLNSSDVNEGLNAKYVPFFDVHKFAKETFDAVKPDGLSYDDVYEKGQDGKYLLDSRGHPVYSKTMVRMEKEGIFPQKVKDTLNQIFSDPRVSQQLGISGEYTYRNHDSAALSEVITTQGDNMNAAYTDKLYNLYLERSLGKSNQDEIDKTQRALETVQGNYANYAQLAYTNPDAVRGLLYKDDVNTRYTTMFGQIKEKKQIMENPGWNQEFKLQQERNEQSRFAQEMHQKKLEFSATQGYRYDALAQGWEIAKLNASTKEKAAAAKKTKAFGEGTGPAGATPEEADKPSTLTAKATQQTNFVTATDNYAVASDNYLWQTMFKGIGRNNDKLKQLTDRGITEADAIKKILDKSADTFKMSPEEFRTTWTNRANTKYKAMSMQDKSKQGHIVGAYAQYSDAKRVFTTENKINDEIQNQLKLQLGEAANKVSMMDIKPQKISYLDKDYEMDKQDMMDLAIIKKYHFDDFASGTQRKAAKEAERRIAAKGKAPLIEAIKFDHGYSPRSVGQVVPLLQHMGEDWFGAKTIFRKVAYDSEWKGRDWGQVDKMEDMLRSEVYEKALVKEEEIINNAYGIKKNLKVGLVTGKNEIDSQTLSNVKRFTGGYQNSGNLSADFKGFAASLQDDMKHNSLEAQAIIGPNNEPMIEVINYKNGQRQGGMIIAPDEAKTLNIDIDALYENKAISSLRTSMKFGGNQSCAGDPYSRETYEQGDSYYDEQDFPMLQGTGVEAQANFVMANGVYYPTVYIKVGNKPGVVRQLPGMDNLEQVAEYVQRIDPTLANKILLEK